MAEKRRVSRRDFLRLAAATATGALAVGCAPAAPQIVEVEKEVPVEKIVKETVVVEKEVPVEKVVTPVPEVIPAEPAEATVMFWDGPPLIGIREESLKPFGDAYPMCKLNFIGAPGEYDDKLLTMLAAGIPPDVFIIEISKLAQYLHKDLLLDIKPFIDRDNFDLTQFPELAIKTYTHEGGIYGLPDNVCSMAIFYNKQMFDEEGLTYPTAQWDDPAWTVDDFINACEKLTKVDSTGRTTQYAFDYRTWLPVMWLWLRVFGGQLVDDPLYPTECTLDQPEAIEGLQFLQDLRWKYGYAPKPEALAEVGASELLMTRRLAMMDNGSWFFEVIREADFEVDVGHYPAGPGGRANYVYYYPLVIPKATKQPECAWNLLKYFSGPGIDAIVRAGGLQGTRFDSQEIFLSDPLPPEHKEVFTDSVKHFVAPDPVLTNWPEIEHVIAAELDLLWINEKSAQDVSISIKQQIDPMIKEGQWRVIE